LKLKTLYDKWEFSRCSPDATEIANDIRIALCELPHEDLIYTCKCSFNPPKKLIKRETPPPPITENYHPEDGVPPPPIDPAEFEALNAEVRRLRDIEREYNLWSKVQKNREPRFEMSKVLQMCIEAEDRAEAAEIELEHLQTIVRKKIMIYEYVDVEKYLSIETPSFDNRLDIAHEANAMIVQANRKLAKEGKRVDCELITATTVSLVITALQMHGYEVHTRREPCKEQKT
jgi:hypothetical protein